MKTSRISIVSLIFMLICSCQQSEDEVLGDDMQLSQAIDVCEFRREIIPPEGYDVIEVSSIDFDGSIRELHFVNDQLGYALATNNVGGYVDVFKTENGGESWHNLAVDYDNQPINIEFKDENVGFISVHDVTGCPPPNCLNKTVVLKTQDGGTTWSRLVYENLKGSLYHLTYDEKGNLYAATFLLDEQGNEQVSIVVSEDDGESWKVLYDSPELSFRLVTFSFTLFGDQIYASGRNGKIVVIDKDGTYLETLQTPFDNIRDLEIVDNSTFIVAADEALRSTDGGKSWTTIYPESARIIGFTSADEGLMLFRKSVCPTDVYQVNDVIAATGDGGASWREGPKVTNLRASFVNSEKISDGTYRVMIGKRLFNFKADENEPDN